MEPPSSAKKVCVRLTSVWSQETEAHVSSGGRGINKQTSTHKQTQALISLLYSSITETKWEFLPPHRRACDLLLQAQDKRRCSRRADGLHREPHASSCTRGKGKFINEVVGGWKAQTEAKVWERWVGRLSEAAHSRCQSLRPSW